MLDHLAVHDAYANITEARPALLENLKQIGQLDALQERIAAVLDEECAALAEAGLRHSEDPTAASAKGLRAASARVRRFLSSHGAMCERICEAKQALAQENYDDLDNQIRRLDDDNKRLEVSFVRKGLVLPLRKRPRIVGPRAACKGGNSAAAASADAPVAAAAAAAAEAAADMPIDPNEPVYCTCRRVAYGQMVACDNPDCELEWFHFGCMGLTRQPAGAWVCPRCTAKRKHARAAARDD